MTLYEIDNAILECVDLETGEIIDCERLEQLQMAFDEKVENIACWIKDLSAEAKAIKEEKDNLCQRQRAAENKAQSLKNYLSFALNGSKFKTPKVSISYRRSEAIEINDIGDIPAEFIKPRVLRPEDASKTDIKEAIKSGQDVPGAVLVEKNNIQVR